MCWPFAATTPVGMGLSSTAQLARQVTTPADAGTRYPEVIAPGRAIGLPVGRSNMSTRFRTYTVIPLDVLVNDPTANYAQGGLSWTLDPGDYFFVAQGDAFGTNGGWGRGVGGQTVLNGAQAGWFYPGVPAMALRLNSVDGSVPAIPEPSTYALLIGGGVFLALVRRRRTGPQAS